MDIFLCDTFLINQQKIVLTIFILLRFSHILLQPFNETVNICHTPIVRKCGDKSVGPDVCSTHYETNCETRYKTYEVEQDEPVCKMELMKKCEDVKSELCLNILISVF